MTNQKSHSSHSAASEASSKAEYAIEFIQAEKTYDSKSGKFQALKPLTLSIRRGEFFGLLGPNGAGKTTAINLLCGVNQLTSGKIKILGHDTVQESNTCKGLIGVVAQELQADSFFELDLMLRIQSKLSGVKPDKEWLDYLLVSLALQDHRHKTTRELSGGMKRRMMIARALAHKPQVIVLDEPTAGVDVELRHSMWEFVGQLHKLGLTIVLTTHYLEEAEQFCERLAIIKQGQLLTVKSNRELLVLGGKPKMEFEISADLNNVELHARLAQVFAEAGFEFLPMAQEAEPVLGTPKALFLASTSFDKSSPESVATACSRVHTLSGQLKFDVAHMKLAQASLEDVFLKLTR